MSQPGKKQESRSIETQLEIAAPIEAVWKALTDPAELVRWFPLEAQVVPGPGGSIRWSWGEPIVADSRIEIWEPNRRLRAVEMTALADHLSKPEETEKLDAPAARARVLDFTLESRGGKTLLRLVHSGFTSGSDWEDEIYSGVFHGWQFELRSLKHYLEHHRGENRIVAWARAECALSYADTWKRLMRPGGLLSNGSLEGLKEGDRYSVRAATGDTLAGIVHINHPDRQFSGTVENRNNGLFRIELTPHSAAREVTVWLSAYGVPRTEVVAFEERWNKLLKQVLA